MDVHEYIDSGVLHDYCMNVLSDTERAEVERMCTLHPQVKEGLLLMEQGLEKFARQTATWPQLHVKETIWSTLENINKEKAGDLNDLPVINKYSDYRNWQRMVSQFVPKELNKDRIVKELRNSGGVSQMLVVSKTDVAEETHYNERESFLVLEGECECHIGDNIIKLGPGGFIEIPMHVSHNVKVLSTRVAAILQHVAV